MLSLDDLFKHDQLDHPKLRYWQALAAECGNHPIVEVVRPRDGLGFAPARLFVTVYDSKGTPNTDGEPWEPQLALATVERGWRGPTADKEVVRIGLLLKTLFAQPQIRYGDGYFSSVLVAELKAGDFSKEPVVEQLLRFISVPAPLASPSRDECAESIKAVLSRVARLLVGPLKYSPAEAKYILSQSVAYFLDERFSITAGRMLGLYRDNGTG